MKPRLQRLATAFPSWLVYGLHSAYLLFRQRWFFDLRSRLRRSAARTEGEDERDLITRISIDGYAVIPVFRSAKWCATAAEEVIRLMEDPTRRTEHSEDSRIFGIEKLSTLAADFAHDPFLGRLASRYANSQEHLLFCMANCVTYRNGVSYGSGGEWHRDGFRRELKAMLYLTDVGSGDGPFAVVRRSHRVRDLLTDSRRIARWIRHGRIAGVTPTRLKDCGERFEGLEPGRNRVFTAAAGTLILFDTSALHAGLPPQSEGKERIALTNYYCHAPEASATLEYYRRYINLNAGPTECTPIGREAR